MNCNKVLEKVFTESMKYQIFITHKICMATHRPNPIHMGWLISTHTISWVWNFLLGWIEKTL